MILLGFFSAFVGFVFLSLAMKHHFKHLLRNGFLSSKKVIVFRLLGAVLLISSGLMCIASHGTGIGLVFWCGLLTFAALLQSLLLTYQPYQLFIWIRKEE